MSIKETYINYGVRSDWASNYEIIGSPASTFKQTSKKNLIAKYQIPEEEIDFVKEGLLRKPINEEIVQNLLERSRFVCCLCKGQKGDAYIIHHIEEYSKTQDNSYNNLAVLCPNDHDLAHRLGTALTNKITPKQIVSAKKSWEKQVTLENKKIAIRGTSTSSTRDWRKVNLYKELQSYNEGDKDIFFGRTDEIDELLKILFKNHVVGLFGESGTGKTSLINAGLIPKLRDDAFTVISIRCLDSPIRRLRENILLTLKSKVQFEDAIYELAIPPTFSEFVVQLKTVLERHDFRIVIIIDQFEELFTRATEDERMQLSTGISEAIQESRVKNKMYFLFSLREDYIGELWDWSHKYSFESVWVRQFRINRLDDEKAFEVIIRPLQKVGIKVNEKFVRKIVDELKDIGNGQIYPPYLQIVCSELYDRFIQKSTSISSNEFSYDLLPEGNAIETLVADYLSESMLSGLTSEEKIYAENVLDLLTGPEGLRTFLTADEISRYLRIEKQHTLRILEHLIKKKIVHANVEGDVTQGYELVHDFLSKKFFDKLGPDAKKNKTAFEIF